ASTSGQGPRFVREPPPRLRFHNSTGGSLECSARGHPTPELRWLALDDTGVAPGAPAIDLPGLRRIRADGSLEFLPFRADQYRQDVHSATYRCLASNRIGTVGSRDVHVRAAHPQPTIACGSERRPEEAGSEKTEVVPLYSAVRQYTSAPALAVIPRIFISKKMSSSAGVVLR
ncbi:hypothetical protein V5799_007752, partial [Amblyomma americanum]